MNNTYRVNISNKNLILQLNSPDATLESVGGKGAALARLVIASEVLSGIAQNFSPDTVANSVLMLSIGSSGANLLSDNTAPSKCPSNRSHNVCKTTLILVYRSC